MTAFSLIPTLLPAGEGRARTLIQQPANAAAEMAVGAGLAQGAAVRVVLAVAGHAVLRRLGPALARRVAAGAYANTTPVQATKLAALAAHPERAREFVRRLTGFSAQPTLAAAGFVVGG